MADESTGLFLRLFYQFLAQQEDLTKAEALRKTQRFFIHGKTSLNQIPTEKREFIISTENIEENRLELRVDGTTGQNPYRHPFYWAPFILMGNWL